ncbi:MULTISPECIES: acyl-CoA dehydrogenase family protein [Streptomyces]|uniref:Acyl-CoA oxidase n=1 Tax=Streptomyces griseus subsp. griseus (strain JCM 4626 / CBS 651.72 / NBRC 13350 / KCC S-0626 / ISP 5235) TaxID=455632 RepID=B1VLS5_STRGG|nr:acyl-CoA dehydrogenase [Streptomyces griseus]BAG23466.1 putative acyl-CoA oxidase [Streptomyces griseus subsp. griseus NBRC 13350]SEE33766.1 Acyl-coenzyme A oxidase [Streptomyces griseus]SQA25105.1 acyl-CoA oxidase [Streptomyces griseus]
MNDAAPPSTNDLLTAVLFGPNFRQEHRFWRRLLTTEPFRRPGGGTPDERLALSYHRLRILNDALDSGARLAADPRALAALHEWLGPVDPALTTVAGIHYNLFLGSLLDHDAGAPRDVSDFLALRRVGTFLCTEVAHGNDAAAIETTATYDRERDGFVLHTPHAGAQKFMPNTSPAGGPKSGVVAARLLVDGADHGVFLFLVPLTDAHRALPGVRVRRLPPRMGSPVDHCLTSFDRRFVPRGALLAGQQGRVGDDGRFHSEVPNRRRRFLASIGRVTPGKLSMSACAVGSARVTLAIAVRYAGHRMISGSRAVGRIPVYAHRTHHGPLAGAMATVYAMSLLHRRALDRWESAPEADRGEAERLVAVAKGWITWQARAVIVECRERCGAQGLLENNGMTELFTGIEGAITAEGDNLAVHAKAAAEMLFSATAPEPAEDDGPGGLDDPVFLGRLFAAVEDLWFARARERMAAAPPGDPLGRWNAASSAALRGVEAHACRQADEAYAEAVASLPEGAARQRLSELRRLFALRWIAHNSGALLASGRLTADQVTFLPDAVEDAVAVVAEHTPALVETFALPERLMSDWPIAGPGYADVYDDPEGPWHRGRRAGIRGRAAEFRRPVCGSRRRPLREKVAALGTRGVLLAYWGTTSMLSRWFEKPQVSVDESVRPKA